MTLTDISIHALRVEGDRAAAGLAGCALISIHALRVEGDCSKKTPKKTRSDFYPRPPGGGRPLDRQDADARGKRFLSTPSGWRATRQLDCRPCGEPFLSTPSGWRATSSFGRSTRGRQHFYPRPPGGGRPCSALICAATIDFYPRPPGGGRLYEVEV